MRKLLIAIAVLAALSAPSTALSTMAHWARFPSQPQDRSVTYRTNVNGPSWSISTAASDWSASAYANYVAGGTATCDTTTWVNICTAYLGLNNQAGRSFIDYQSGTMHMLDAFTQLNRTYGDTANDTWRRAAVCHEMGHDLGLYLGGAERQTTGSCTYQSICPPPCTPTYYTPDTTDFSNIETNSNHLDSLQPGGLVEGGTTVRIEVDTMVAAIPLAKGAPPVLIDVVKRLK